MRMNNEQYPLWIFDEHSIEDLKEVLELNNRMGELGFPTLPDNEIQSIKAEIVLRSDDVFDGSG